MGGAHGGQKLRGLLYRGLLWPPPPLPLHALAPLPTAPPATPTPASPHGPAASPAESEEKRREEKGDLEPCFFPLSLPNFFFSFPPNISSV